MSDSTDDLVIRALGPQDPPVLEAAFAAIGWNKQASRYERYLVEQADGIRDILVAELEGVFAGYGTLLWRATYPPFRDASIPEVQDLNVLPHLHRRGVASRLMDEAESRIAARGDTAGIGFGMTENYGAAQRMYVLRGYVPDGRGLMYNEQPVEYFGPAVIPDDDLVLYLTKRLDR
jgi:GNAT superfamily N-acetyltransferase